MRVDVVFIGTGLIFLLIGMVFGAWMGAVQDFQYAGAHAHWNLLGFVASTLYGLVHRAYPGLAKSRLAWVQCIAHIVGSLSFGPGLMLMLATENMVPLAVGVTLVFGAALMFLFMFVTGDKRAVAN